MPYYFKPLKFHEFKLSISAFTVKFQIVFLHIPLLQIRMSIILIATMQGSMRRDADTNKTELDTVHNSLFTVNFTIPLEPNSCFHLL